MYGSNIRICICGGGSLGHVCAAVLASREGVSVSILSCHPASWQKSVSAEDPFGMRWIKELAEENGVPTPIIDIVYNWGTSNI